MVWPYSLFEKSLYFRELVEKWLTMESKICQDYDKDSNSVLLGLLVLIMFLKLALTGLHFRWCVCIVGKKGEILQFFLCCLSHHQESN